MELKQFKRLLPRLVNVLLIVPYGIETTVGLLAALQRGLLIVPYGIETR